MTVQCDFCSVTGCGTVHFFSALHEYEGLRKIARGTYLRIFQEEHLKFCFLGGMCCNSRFENLLSGNTYSPTRYTM